MSETFEIARKNMVVNQLRPNKINEENILQIFENTPKENYLDVNNCEIDKELINKILNERIKGKPLAKIINEKGFWKNIFYTDDYTLDPRADSEILVEHILNDCTQIKNKKKFNFLDLCCGTGCLGISIIDELENSFCDFIDISKKALNACKKNIIKFEKQKNSKLFHSNLFENYPINRLKNVDVIVCNPPYIPVSYTHLTLPTRS